MTPRVVFGCLGLAALLAGCGGGGPSAEGGGGGGGTVVAGPIQVEGQIDAPLNGIASGVTTYALTGNITAATMTDRTPTLEETEVLYSRLGPAGYEIMAADYPEGEGARSVVANMPQSANSLAMDRAGKYVYYIRNYNLQRTEIRDGTSNTILASVDSFAFNESGSQVVYRKRGTTQIWRANPNGSGQVLVSDYPSDNVQLVGCLTDALMIVRRGADQRSFSLLDTGSGSLGGSVLFISTVNIYWTTFNFEQRRCYVYVQVTTPVVKYEIYRLDFSASGVGVGPPLWSSPNALPIYAATAGPRPESLFGHDGRSLYPFNAFGQVQSPWATLEDFLYGLAWTPYRTSLPLVGAGTPFAGAGALLATEHGTKAPAVVAADAVTRNSMAVTNLNTTGTGNPLWRIDCDNLNRLSYAQGNGYVWNHLIGAASGLKGAIVSFYGGSGRIANIVTFTRRPTVKRVGNGWTIEGELADVYDAKSGAKSPAPARVVIP